MKAAVVDAYNAPPRYADFADPVPRQGESIVKVNAAALTMLVKSQANGSHYSSDGKLPFIPGNDGVGRLLDGRRVYFLQPRRPYGSMAEFALVRPELCIPLPEDLDAITAAAMGNPGMSSWAALTLRAKLVPGETVLINGATGSAGRLAVQIAKHLGAERVIATGRNQAVLETLPALGADAVLSLDQSDQNLIAAFRHEVLEKHIDVVLDYVWGHPAECLIQAIAGGGARHGMPRLRLIQIGSMAANTISLPAAALRSSGLELLGSGLGSVTDEDLLKAIGELMQVVIPAKLKIATETAPLAEVESAWNRDTGERRLIFTT